MSLTHQISEKVYDQCLNLIGSKENQNKLKSHLIDPLVTYFKNRLRFFYVIITLLLCLILIANTCLIFQMFGLKNHLEILSFSLPKISKMLP